MLTVGLGRGSVRGFVVCDLITHTAPAIIFFSRRQEVVLMVTSTVNARVASNWEFFGAIIPSVGGCTYSRYIR